MATHGDREKLPEGFPGLEALEAEGIKTYGQVRKRIEAGDLTEISGVGESTAAKIMDSAESDITDGDEASPSEPTSTRKIRRDADDDEVDPAEGPQPHPDLSKTQIVPSAPNSPNHKPPHVQPLDQDPDVNPDGTKTTANQVKVREILAARKANDHEAIAEIAATDRQARVDTAVSDRFATSDRKTIVERTSRRETPSR